MKRVEIYVTESGNEPFTEWVESLSDEHQTRVFAYMGRLARGAAKKNIRPLGDSLYEIKMDFGKGYRTYFSESENTIIILLTGGDKGSQKRDIQKAKEYWRTYHEKNRKL